MAYVITEPTAPKLFTMFKSPQYSRILVEATAAEVLPTIGTLTLYSWEGVKGTPAGTTVNTIVQRMTERVTSLNATETTFNIAPYLNDFFKEKLIDEFLPLSANYHEQDSEQQFWYYYTIAFNNGAATYTSTTNLAMGGWGLHSDGVNSGFATYAELDAVIFGVSNDQAFTKDSDQLFYVFTGVGSTNTELEETATPNFHDFTLDGFYLSDRSEFQFAQFNAAKIPLLTSCMELEFKLLGVGTGVYKMQEETNRNKHIEVRYIGKNGFQNSLHFLGRINEALNVTNLQYEKSNHEVIGVADFDAHVNTDINIQGGGTVIANTGDISEVESRFLIELLLSDKVWIVETDDTLTPVTVATKKLDIQNARYEALRNHAITFKFSNPIVNQV